jgi:hypothetical protein
MADCFLVEPLSPDHSERLTSSLGDSSPSFDPGSPCLNRLLDGNGVTYTQGRKKLMSLLARVFQAGGPKRTIPCRLRRSSPPLVRVPPQRPAKYREFRFATRSRPTLTLTLARAFANTDREKGRFIGSESRNPRATHPTEALRHAEHNYAWRKTVNRLAREMISADLISDSTNCSDKRVVGTGVKLAPQIVHIYVDHIRDGVGVHPPNLLDNRRA